MNVEKIFGFHNEFTIKIIETDSSETDVSDLQRCSKWFFLRKDEVVWIRRPAKCSRKWPNIRGILAAMRVTTGQDMLQKLQNIHGLRCLWTSLYGNLERISGRPDDCITRCDSEEKNSKINWFRYESEIFWTFRIIL